MVKDSRRDVQFGAKWKNGIPYMDVGLASGNLRFENSWMEFFEEDWLTQIDFLKINVMDFA